MVVVRRAPRIRPVAVLLLLSLTLIVIDRAITGPTDWARSVTQDTFAAAGSAINRISPFAGPSESALQQENESLRAQLQEAQGQLASSADDRRQLASLSSLLNIQTPDNIDRVVVPITASNVSNYDAAIEIGKGTSDGIQVGMPVMTGNGLVGRVVQTSTLRATVQLITDSTFEVGIRFGSTGEVAIAIGQGAGKPMRGDLVDLDSKTAIGDVAVTNGQANGLFPAGIPIATLATSEAGNQDLRRHVTLNPTADMDALADVAVLLWTPQS